MPSWPFTFANESGSVPASQLDSNFAAAAFASDLTALSATVAGLPTSTTPSAPTPGGAVGVATTLARADHQHPMQPATKNPQSGTTYTVASTDNGLVVTLNNAGAITVTIPNTLTADFSCVFIQLGAGQVTFTAAAGATQRQRQSFTKTAGQYAAVSLIGLSNSGGTSFVYLLSGDMSA